MPPQKVATAAEEAAPSAVPLFWEKCCPWMPKVPRARKICSRMRAAVLQIRAPVHREVKWY